MTNALAADFDPAAPGGCIPIKLPIRQDMAVRRAAIQIQRVDGRPVGVAVNQGGAAGLAQSLGDGGRIHIHDGHGFGVAGLAAAGARACCNGAPQAQR